MKKSFAFHHLLLAISPIISLYAANAVELRLNELMLPLALALPIALILWGLLWWWRRDLQKSALLTSLFAVWFLSYGHLEQLLLHSPLKATILAFPATMLLPWCALLIAGAWWLIATRRSLQLFTSVLNAAAVILLVLPVLQISRIEVERAHITKSFATLTHSAPLPEQQQTATDQVLPDIYYIILDGYARADTLKTVYHYDNTPFLTSLTDRGFVVAHHSRSNYCQTVLSLASSLNFRYLYDLDRQMPPTSRDMVPLMRMIDHNGVFDVVRRHGYSTVAYASGYQATCLRSADRFVDDQPGMSVFHGEILNMTPASYLLRKQNGLTFNQYAQHREGILRIFGHLGRPLRSDKPIFVFAHIIAPHPPFLFDRNGNSIQPDRNYVLADASDFIKYGGTRNEYLAQYADQLAFINRKVEKAVEGILSNAEKTKRPAVIIIQGDHGPGSQLNWDYPSQYAERERFYILNAIYLPKGEQMAIPDDLTPVNTFRLIFNHFFHTEYEMQPNLSYYSPSKRPYKFSSVTDKIPQGWDEK
ncbi:MAG: sulfatase-like hydrolase/transferase [Armatimonadota bacterium]